MTNQPKFVHLHNHIMHLLTAQYNHMHPLLCCLYSAHAHHIWGKKATSLDRNTKQIHVQSFSNTPSSVAENQTINNSGLQERENAAIFKKNL